MKPTFMIVGAAKAGTSSIWAYLNSHPEVYMSGAKEPHYYADGFGVDDEEAYERLFREARPGQQRGEASTSYLFIPDVADRLLADLGPGLRIIIMLRDPIRTAHSLWAYNTSIGREWLSFHDALENEDRRFQGLDERANRALPNLTVLAYTRRVKYAAQVKRYLERFDDVYVAFFEEFFTAPEREYLLLCRFLNVSEHHPRFDLVNRGGVPRNRAGQALLAATSPGRNHRWWTPIRDRVPQSWRAGARHAHSSMRSRLIASKPPIDSTSTETVRAAVSGDIPKLELLLGRTVPDTWSDYSAG